MVAMSFAVVRSKGKSIVSFLFVRMLRVSRLRGRLVGRRAWLGRRRIVFMVVWHEVAFSPFRLSYLLSTVMFSEWIWREVQAAILVVRLGGAVGRGIHST